MTVADFFYDFYVYLFAAIVLVLPTLLVAMWGLNRRAPAKAAHRAPVATERTSSVLGG